MPCRIPLTVVLFTNALLLTTIASAQPAIQRASCVLRMETDERFGPAASTAGVLTAALTSTALLDPAMQAGLGLGPDQWPTMAQVDVQSAGEAAVKLTVTVKPLNGMPFPPDAARRILTELTRGAVRSFNGPTTGPDVDPNVARLREEQRTIDAKLYALRAEMDAATLNANRRDSAMRANTKAMLEQQLADQRGEIGVQRAAMKVIDERLPSLEKEADADLRALRAKLTGERIEAEIACAKASARIEQLVERIAEQDRDLAAAATQPTRSPMTIQAEQNELASRRSAVDQELARATNRRDNLPKPRLIVVDGGAN